MKKFLLVIPIVLIILHILNQADAGPLVWTQDLTGSAIWQHGIAINPTNQQIMYAASNGQGIWKTTNGGLTWAQSNSGLTNLGLFNLAISNSNPNIIYAGTIQTGSSPGMYKSTDAAATWTQINTGLTESSIAIAALAVDPTNPNIVYVAIFDGVIDAQQGVYKTTNGGTTWTVANTGIGVVKNILSIVINPVNPNSVYCGTSFGVTSASGPVHIYKSVNGAGTWTDMSSGLPSASTDTDPVRDMYMSTVDTSTILAGLFENTTGGGAFVTNNGGVTWTKMSNGIPAVTPFLLRSVLIRPGTSNEFFVGTDPSTGGGVAGVYHSTDGGISWTSLNNGTMTSTSVVRALNWRTSDNTLLAGVAVGPTGVHEYSFLPLGINGNNNQTPTSFKLSQNYPNPFNPSTVIQYAVPKTSLVTIKVYDMSGREVQTLVYETKNTGTYQVNFNASNLASGVYLYKIQAGDFRDTKKMILVK